MKITLIKKAVGCHKGRCHRVWRGEWRTFDFEKPFDCLRWKTITRLEWLRELPGVMAWRIADRLCSLASKLRKQERHEGWYGINCNEAERLRQNIEEHLIPMIGLNGEPEPLMINPDDAESMRENLDRLAALARATYWHDI